MRGLHNAWAGWYPFVPPGSLVHFATTGDSMSVGTNSGGIPTITTSHGVVKLFDSSGTYDINNPNAGTLSLQPMTCPQRAIGSGGLYPANEFGYSLEFFICEQFAQMATGPGGGYLSYPLSASVCGTFALDLAAISTGTTPYKASTYEIQAYKRLNGSLFVAGVVCTVGGINAVEYTSTAAYQAAFATFAAGYDTDIRAITGQSTPVPMFASQQIALPNYGFGPNLIAPAQLAVALASGGSIVCPCPRYPYPTSSDHGHLSDYSGMGYKHAQAIYEHTHGNPWLPLYATGIVRVGTQVTVTFQVRHLPLVFASANDNDDHTVAPPHQVGVGYSPITPWAAGKGFEAWDSPMTPTSATNATPIVLGFGSAMPAQVTSGSMLFVDGILGNTNANGAYFVNVLDSQHVALYHDAGLTSPVAGNGVATFPSPATRAFAVIGITSAVIAGSTVVLTLARSPGTGLHIGYADTPDGYAYNVLTGGFPSGRCGILRDSDPFVDVQGRPQYNWAVEFSQAVA